MKIYLVGGAVRDTLLGRHVTERDWVVVGSTPEAMQAQGYTPVGKDFPVFLHPKTGEEYALARTERKTAKGYKGFCFNADPSVTLEEDLIRRDLTVNAMAQDDDGTIIDPFNGQSDLNHKILRHVSDAFAEDPVRILRIARFASRYSEFTVHPDTLNLMTEMVEAGEVDALVPERVWKECSRALSEPEPTRFFTILAQCGALKILFKELLYPEGMAILYRAVSITGDARVRFAAMLYNLAPENVKSLCKRLKVPSDTLSLSLLLCQYHDQVHGALLDNPESIVSLLEKLDAFRRPDRLSLFITACMTHHENIDPRILPTLNAALLRAKSVNAKTFVDQGLEGEAIGMAVHQARVNTVRELISD